MSILQNSTTSNGGILGENYSSSCTRHHMVSPLPRALLVSHWMNLALNLPSCLTAFLVNVLVLACIWKRPHLHSPSNVLVAGLALSDLGVGLVLLPMNIAREVAAILMHGETAANICNVGSISSSYLCTVSLLTTTAIGLDRYLALRLHLRYQVVITLGRSVAVLVSIWLLSAFPVTIAWCHVISNFAASCMLITFISICLFLSAFSYLKIFKVIRHHRAQIHGQTLFHGKHEGLNMASYRKSVTGAFSMYCVLLACYIPFLGAYAAEALTGFSITTAITVQFSITLMFLSSSFNPFLNCWRIRELRVAMKQLVKKVVSRCGVSRVTVSKITHNNRASSCELPSVK